MSNESQIVRPLDKAGQADNAGDEKDELTFGFHLARHSAAGPSG